MHQLTLNNIRLITVLLVISASSLVFSECGQKKEDEKINQEVSEQATWTDTVIGNYYVRIHYPGPDDHPDGLKIWEGPVEIGKKPDTFSCMIDTGIVQGIRKGLSENTLIIEVFSGSSPVYDVVVNVDSCKVIK